MKAFFLILSIISILTFIAALACQNYDFGACSYLGEYAAYAGSGAIHLGLLSLALFFLWKKDLRSTFASIGFPGRHKESVFYGAMTLSAIFLVLFMLGMAAILLHFNDQQKVSDKIESLPLAILVFAVVGAPITEELFFRGFLTNRAGVVLSALFFGLMHFAYGSTVEVLGTFMIGLVLAASFKLTRSITPCIIAHMAYNAISITFMRLLS